MASTRQKFQFHSDAIKEENDKPKEKTRVSKPSYSNLNMSVPTVVSLSTNQVTGYRLMYPGAHLERTCLSTESAENIKPNVEDIPLGAKLPHISGNNVVLVTTDIGKRLQKPSCDFDISTPKETYISNEYNDLHDPHLTLYFKKNEGLKQHLVDMGYITPNGHVICSLQKYNLYRQYLKRLSIDLLNKKYHEQFSHEIKTRKDSQKQSIETIKNSKENPIALRLNNANQRRLEIEGIKEEKLLSAQEEKNKRITLWEDETNLKDQLRINRIAQLENEREKRKVILEIKEHKEKTRIHELVLKKHYEDQKRIYELTKRKRKAAMLRRHRLEQAFVRKTHYHKEKQNDLILLAAEHELRRQARVNQWELYFTQQLELQNERLKKLKQSKIDAKRKKSVVLSKGDAVSDKSSTADSDIASISESSVTAFELDSDAASTVQFKAQSQYIVKQVFHSLKYSLPTLEDCIKDFETTRGRNMSDEEIIALLHKMNTEGTKDSILSYNSKWHHFLLTNVQNEGDLEFDLEDIRTDHRLKFKKLAQRRMTPAVIDPIIQDEDDDILTSTVRALSFKVVRKVMKKCGLAVDSADVVGIALAILNEIGGLSDSESESGRESRVSESSAATQSTTMHELADKFIVQLLGLESDRSTTEISKFSSDEVKTQRSLICNDDLNIMALDVVKQALNAEDDSMGSTKDTENVDVNKELKNRMISLSSNVVKKAVRSKLDIKASEETLLAQDVNYLENRVVKLADRILETMVPNVVNPKITSAHSSKASSRNSGRISRLSEASTLPENYDERVNKYTSRIIETLLSMKSIMPHPKPQKMEADRTVIGTIARCINFEELYKAPKQAFNLNAQEITGLAQALADKITIYDMATSADEVTSPREGLVEELAGDIVEKQDLLHRSMSPRSATSSDSQSQMAFKIVENAVKRGNFVQAQDILSDGGSQFADKVISKHLDIAQKRAEESAESALEDMAKEAFGLADSLVKIIDQDYVTPTESDSVGDIADKLAGLIVDYGEEKYLKDNLDKKAHVVGQEVSSIAHDLIKELLMSAKASKSQISLSKSSRSGSYVKRMAAASTSTDTLESAISEAIGVLAQTCIKSDPSDERILRTKSEVAIRNLLRALQGNLKEDEEDVKSVGSSAASVLAHDIADSVVTNTERKLNLHDASLDTKPDWTVTRGIQVAAKPIDKRANELLTAILGELNSVTESNSKTTFTSSGGFDDMDEATHQVSRLLVKRLVPQLIEHFRPPTPPEMVEHGMNAVTATATDGTVTASCFRDFRKTGIMKREQIKFSSTSDSTSATSLHIDCNVSEKPPSDITTTTASGSKFANRVDMLANNIVTKVIKDDRLDNVRKADQIHMLVNDLALGIVETVLESTPSRPVKSKRKPQSPSKGKRTGPSADTMLEKALYRNKRVMTRTEKQLDKLAESMVSEANKERTTGSSRVTSGQSHDLSDVDKMTYNILRNMPLSYEVPPESLSGESVIARNLMEGNQNIEISDSPRSDNSKFISDLVQESMIHGRISQNSTASSLAENLIVASIPYAVQSTKTGESSVAELLVAKSILNGQYTESPASEFAENLITKSCIDGEDTKSAGSSLAEEVVAEGLENAALTKSSDPDSMVEDMIVKSVLKAEESSPISDASSLAEEIVKSGWANGMDKAMSKSPASSIAEDILRNLSPFEAGSHCSDLADDILEHLEKDL